MTLCIGQGQRCPLKILYMQIIFFHERRVQGTTLSGSKSRISITSSELVLLNDVKKRRRKKLGRILRLLWKAFRKGAEFIFAIGFIAKLILVILNHLGW